MRTPGIGFDRGGWAVPYNDEVMAQRMGEAMSSSGVMLFGRRTYQDFYGYWPRDYSRLAKHG